MRACLAVLALALAPGLALAQDPAPRRGPIVLEEQVIPGRVQRPHAMYVLTRARPRFDRVDDAHHSVDRIVDSVTRAPF